MPFWGANLVLPPSNQQAWRGLESHGGHARDESQEQNVGTGTILLKWLRDGGGRGQATQQCPTLKGRQLPPKGPPVGTPGNATLILASFPHLP